jgi:hypothetical protein
LWSLFLPAIYENSGHYVCLPSPLLGPIMCLQSHLQTSPPTPQKSYPKFRNHIFKKRPKKDLKIAPRGPGGGGANLIFFSEFLLFFFRGACKNLEPYDNPFCGFE